MDTGYWIQDTGYSILNTGYRILDTGYKIQDTGIYKICSRILDIGVNHGLARMDLID